MLRLLDRFLVEQRIGSMDDISGECLEQFLASRERVNPRSYNHLLRRGAKALRLERQPAGNTDLATTTTATTRDRSALAIPVRSSPPSSSACWPKPHCCQTILAAPCAGRPRDHLRAARRPGATHRARSRRLQYGDVDLERDVLQIRDSKFGKSRLVPFGPRLAARVRAYLQLRERLDWPCAGSAPLFSWNGRSPVSTNTIRNTFRDDLTATLGSRCAGRDLRSTRARAAAQLRRSHLAALVP